MNWLKKYFYLFPVLLYLPALGNFFSGDDWFHLRITQIDSLQQFLNFFSFNQNAQSASFYRPLSTQVFFFIFQRLFGLTPWPYYFFGLILFAYILYLIKKLSEIYLPSTIYHLRSTTYHLPSIIYGLSVSNFTRVYFASAYQELFLVVFSLLTLTNFRSKPKLSLFFFLLALLSKETAIVLPALIFLINYKDLKIKQHFLFFIFYFLLSLIYLYLRLFHFGLVVGDSYTWDFSLVKLTNTLMWYFLWSLGAPELLVDYVGSGLRLIPRFFTDYSVWWPFIVLSLLSLIATLSIVFLKNFKKLNSQFWVFITFFVVSLLPVLFLPSHKFALELGLPLVGFAIATSLLLQKSNKFFYFVFLSFFVLYNLSMNYLTYTRHYTVSRGQISKKVYQYFSHNYPSPSKQHYFEFINDANDYGSIWGQSKQISQSLSGSDFFKVFYRQPEFVVYYQDMQGQRPKPPEFTEIKISTKQFLNQ